MSKKKPALVAAAVALPLLLMLGGCAPGSAGGSHAANTATASKDVAKEGKVTLKLLDYFQGDESKWMNQVIAGFEKKYPTVKVKRTVQDWGQVMSTLNLRMANANGPDIATVNNGWQSMGTLAKGGLILNLDAYSKLYGWNKEIPATMLRQLEFTPDGKTMGSGSLYAAPTARSSLIGLYYNKKVLESAGLSVPKTFADFESDAKALKAAGKTPIAYGSLDKDSSTALLFAVQDVYGTANNIGDFVYDSKKLPIGDTGLTQAATTVKQWADDGWFSKNYAGLQVTDAQQQFLDGKAAFRFDYTGSYAFTTAQKADYGYLQLPQADGSGVVGTGSPSGNFSISSKTKYPNAAAAFLNYMTSKTAAQLAVDHGFLPLLHSGLNVPSDNAEFATEVAGQQSLDSGNGYVPYFDWSTPTMLDTLGGQLQSLLAGRVTPAQLAAAGQADYDKFQQSRTNG